MDPELLRKLRHVRILGLDVDGVLTDGGVYVLNDGREARRFNIKDGLGLKLVMASGILVAWISSAAAGSIAHRARVLGISELFVDVEDKLQTLRDICRRFDVNLNEVAYMGDDLPDVPVLQEVGLPCAPADAVAQVQATAILITRATGGNGAVRELCDLLVDAQNEPPTKHVRI